jgi:predicted RNA methylase
MKRTTCTLLTACLITGLLASAARAADAKAILDATGVQGGLIVHLGCGDGELTAALRASEAYVVHALDADGKNVAAARKFVAQRGLYGHVSVERLAGARLPYADNLVNLVVASDPGKVPPAEVMRVLVPRGVA